MDSRSSVAAPSVWIDTDAGIDDALCLLLCLKCADVRGISCSYGNCPQRFTVRNVSRIVNGFVRQHPEIKIPKICLSCDHNDSKLIRKPVDDTDLDCWHGKDGLGDCQEFEAENDVPAPSFEIVEDYVSEIRSQIALCKKRT